MVDSQTQNSDVDQRDEITSENEGDSKRKRLIVLIVLILLLLCCCCAGSFGSEGLFSAGPQKAQFIARNLECLQCHTELIPELGRSSVHEPFLDKECTICHTPHGAEVRVTVSSEGAYQSGEASWWDSFLGSIFGRDSWVLKWFGTGEGSFYWNVFGSHADSLYTRFVNWIKWSPYKLIAVIQGRGADVASDGSTGAGGAMVREKSYLTMPINELCMMCHGSIGIKMNSAFPHDPVVNGNCTSCHDPHASDHGALLNQSRQTICLTCHGANMPFDAAQLHPPFKNGNCLDCHDAHGSDHRGIILRPQRELCFTCHPSVASQSGRPVQHEPFFNDDCTGCHDPHGSNNLPLLNQPQPELCYSCHPSVRNEFNQPSHHPIRFDMSCGSCHEPHAAFHDGLLVASGNSLCTRCHSALGQRYSQDAHFNTPCARCHAAHGSQFKPMLKNSNPELCLECHVNYDEQNASGERLNRHPVRPSWYDVASGKRLTCTSTCHDPHGTPHNYLLKPTNYPYDGNCLICHQVVPGWKVGVDY